VSDRIVYCGAIAALQYANLAAVFALPARVFSPGTGAVAAQQRAKCATVGRALACKCEKVISNQLIKQLSDSIRMRAVVAVA